MTGGGEERAQLAALPLPLALRLLGSDSLSTPSVRWGAEGSRAVAMDCSACSWVLLVSHSRRGSQCSAPKLRLKAAVQLLDRS